MPGGPPLPNWFSRQPEEHKIRISLVDIPETMDALAKAIDDVIEAGRLVMPPGGPQDQFREEWADGYRQGWLAAKEAAARAFAAIRVRLAAEAIVRLGEN